MSELEQAADRAKKIADDLSEDRQSLLRDAKHVRGVELLDAVRAAADELAARLRSNQNKSGPTT